MSIFNAYMSLSGAYAADVKRSEPLSHRTNCRIGGACGLFVEVHSYTALVRVLSVLAQEHIDWVIVGRGSSLLVSDRGYEGCVIVLGGEFSKLQTADDGHSLTVGAGALLSQAVNAALKASLSGFECCAGIPGTVGGALSMNAGAQGVRLGDCVSDLVVLRPGEGLKRYSADELTWNRASLAIPTSEIILEATFTLELAAQADVAMDMQMQLKQRRRTQPLSAPSLGPLFRDPIDRSASTLLETSGVGNESSGAAQILRECPNYLLNRGGATARDALHLLQKTHDAVFKQTGIDLGCAVKLLGFGA